MNFAITLNHNRIHCTYNLFFFCFTIKRHYFRCAIDEVRSQCVVYISQFCFFIPSSAVSFAPKCALQPNASGVKIIIRYLWKCSFSSIWIDLFVGVMLFHFMAYCCSSIIPVFFFHQFRFSCTCWDRCACNIQHIPHRCRLYQGHSINIHFIEIFHYFLHSIYRSFISNGFSINFESGVTFRCYSWVLHGVCEI